MKPRIKHTGKNPALINLLKGSALGIWIIYLYIANNHMLLIYAFLISMGIVVIAYFIQDDYDPRQGQKSFWRYPKEKDEGSSENYLSVFFVGKS
jgi:hypothetical protein